MRVCWQGAWRRISVALTPLNKPFRLVLPIRSAAELPNVLKTLRGVSPRPPPSAFSSFTSSAILSSEFAAPLGWRLWKTLWTNSYPAVKPSALFKHRCGPPATALMPFAGRIRNSATGLPVSGPWGLTLVKTACCTKRWMSMTVACRRWVLSSVGQPA